MTTWDRLIFLVQVKGTQELAKMIGHSETHLRRVLAKTRPMSKVFIEEIEELYALREECMKRSARFYEHIHISEMEH